MGASQHQVDGLMSGASSLVDRINLDRQEAKERRDDQPCEFLRGKCGGHFAPVLRLGEVLGEKCVKGVAEPIRCGGFAHHHTKHLSPQHRVGFFQ